MPPPSNESTEFVEGWKKAFKGGDNPLPTNLAARDYIGMKLVLEAITKAGSTGANPLIPAFEGLHLKTITGKVMMRACNHKLILPLQCVEIAKEAAPHLGIPITIPASATMINERDVEHLRCRRK